MSWVAGIVALLVLALTLKRIWWAPIAGVVGQLFWIAYIIMDSQWGLLPCTLAYLALYIYYIPIWKKEHQS